MKTLYRYLVHELILPFLMGLTVFTFILIMDKIFTLTDLIVKYGVSVWLVAKLALLILPATFAITIPMACLVAVMVGFSRLNADNEIIAIKASGISLLPFAILLLALGTLITGLMIWFDNSILPQANLSYRDLYFRIVSQRAAIVVQEHVFVEDFDGYVFRVGDKHPLTGELKDIVVFVEGQKSADPARTILAQHGQLISDEQNRRVMLKLEHGFMQMVPKADPQAFSCIYFDTVFLDLDINRELAVQDFKDSRSGREMSMAEIQKKIFQESKNGQDINLLRVEYHKKLSIPFACLAFILIGTPIGILAPHRSGRYFAYFVGVALIFVYYIFISLGETFGADGRMPPLLAMWLPNLLLVLAGIYGLVWVLKEQPPFYFIWHHWLRRPK